MKQLTCEMCGSNDLIKQDGVFVCQSCGCKYSVEEAKKMMVEGTVEVTGTVKIDDEKETLNLKQLALNAKNRKDYKEAAKYYNELLLKEPNSWEANYYTVYAQAMDIKVGEIPNEITRVSNNIPTVFSLINKSNYTSSEKVDIIKEIGKTFFELTILFFENYKMEGSLGTRIKILEAQEDFYMQICNHFSDDKEFMDTYGINLLSSKLNGVYVFEEEILSKENHLYYAYDCKKVCRPSKYVQGAMEKTNTCCRIAIEKINPELFKEIRRQKEKKQEELQHRMKVVKEKTSNHKKHILVQAIIISVFLLLCIIINADSVDSYSSSTYDTSFLCLLISVMSFVADIIILLFSILNIKKEYETLGDKAMEKAKKNTKTATSVCVVIISVCCIISGTAIFKVSTVRNNFNSIEYITTMLENNPTTTTLKAATYNQFDDDRYGSYGADTFSEVSNTSKVVRVAEGSWTCVHLDEKNKIEGFTMELADIFNSLSKDYGGYMTENDLKDKLGNYKRIEIKSSTFLRFRINGCDVYIREEYNNYTGNTNAFIMKP